MSVTWFSVSYHIDGCRVLVSQRQGDFPEGRGPIVDDAAVATSRRVRQLSTENLIAPTRPIFFQKLSPEKSVQWHLIAAGAHLRDMRADFVQNHLQALGSVALLTDCRASHEVICSEILTAVKSFSR